MRSWNRMEPFFKRGKACRHCGTSSTMKKMKDTISKVSKRIKNLWSGRKKRR